MELKSRITPVVILLFLFYVGFSVQATAQKSGTGSIVGTVKDKNSENPLPAAKVTVDGTLLTAIADSVGQYRLAGVPTGDHTLRISYIGYNDSSVDVNVKEEEALEVDVLLLPYMRLTVEVTAPYLEGQERALNEQNASLKIENVVAADQIGNFPDQNAAEALQRIPRHHSRAGSGRRTLRAHPRNIAQPDIYFH
jgi:hypothetical protein